MSQFSDNCINSVIKGLNLQQTEYQKEVSLGVFDSGFNNRPNATNERFLDLRINKHIWGVITKDIDFEFQGGWHTSIKPHLQAVEKQKLEPKTTQTAKKIMAARSFADQILRDQWVANEAAANNRLMIWVMIPEYDSMYDQHLNDLYYKLSTIGFLTEIFQNCEKKGAKGAVIYHDHVNYIIDKDFPKPQIPSFMSKFITK